MCSLQSQIRRLVLLLMASAALVSCGDKSDPSVAPRKPATFDRARFDDITPLADGSAYVSSLDSRLWYLRGNRAVPVTGLGNDSTKLPRFLEITPLMDGGAYATSWGK